MSSTTPEDKLIEMERRWKNLPPHTYERFFHHYRWLGLSAESIPTKDKWIEIPTQSDDHDCIYPIPPGVTTNRPVPAPPKSPADLRAEFLDVVKGYVTKDRAATHGDAEDNFADIADLLNIVLGKKLKVPLDSLDVSAAMICVKLARIKSTPEHLDHWQDTAGYAACGGGIIMKKGQKQ
jgi:hypothetical protein